VTDAWNRAAEMADKHASQGGLFIRLQNDGDKVVGAFCGEPHAREVVWTGEGYEAYDEDNPAHEGKRPALRVALNFFVPAERAMKVIEVGVSLFRDIVKVRDKYGLSQWTFEIERQGAKGDPKTRYSLLPDTKIDAELRRAIDAAPPHDLAHVAGGGEGGPSGSGGSSADSGFVGEAVVEEFAAALRRLPRPAVDHFLAELGVDRIRKVRAADEKLARELIRELEAKHAPKEQAEVDPFA